MLQILTSEPVHKTYLTSHNAQTCIHLIGIWTVPPTSHHNWNNRNTYITKDSRMYRCIYYMVTPFRPALPDLWDTFIVITCTHMHICVTTVEQPAGFEPTPHFSRALTRRLLFSCSQSQRTNECATEAQYIDIGLLNSKRILDRPTDHQRVPNSVHKLQHWCPHWARTLWHSKLY